MSTGQVSAQSVDAKVIEHEEAAHEKRNWVRLTFDCNNHCVFCLDTLSHDGNMRDANEVKAQILDGALHIRVREGARQALDLQREFVCINTCRAVQGQDQFDRDGGFLCGRRRDEQCQGHQPRRHGA